MHNNNNNNNIIIKKKKKKKKFIKKKKKKKKKGYNTVHALELFPKIFNKEICKDTLLMTLFFGANDCSLNPIQMITPEAYVKNMRQLIQLSLETFPENCPIIVITPPPCYARKFNEDHDFHDHENKRTEEFRNLCLATVKEFSNNARVFHIDIWEDILGESWDTETEEFNEKINQYLCDGLHLNAAGNDLIYNNLIKLIDEKLPHLSSDNLSLIGPYWRDINPINYKVSF